MEKIKFKLLNDYFFGTNATLVIIKGNKRLHIALPFKMLNPIKKIKLK